MSDSDHKHESDCSSLEDELSESQWLTLIDVLRILV